MFRWMTVLLCALALPALADEPLRTISVSGMAKQMAEPDEAVIRFTMESRNKELAAVKQMQDEKIAKLLALAGELQIEKKHLQTQSAQIHPEYRYHDGKRYFDGYRSAVSVVMELKDIHKAPAALEGLVAAGFDQIGNVHYQVKDREALQEALKLEALANAKEKAAKMAEAVGMKLGAAIQIQESGGIVSPPPVMNMRAMAMAADIAEAAPQAPPAGEQEVRQTISVLFEMEAK